MTYREAIQKAFAILDNENIDNAKGDARTLFQYVTGLSQTDILLRSMDEMSIEQEEKYFQAVQQRKNHIPLQYITNEQCFMGLSFFVNEHVLIPRYDTEILVEEVLKLCQDEMRVHDMCTGSGCIITSLKVFKPGIIASGSDISSEALEVAKKNAKANEADVSFYLSDLFDEIEGLYDIIVSNPPYIETKEIEKLSVEVKDHEPMRALDGKEDGLYFYRFIIDEGWNYLKPEGYLCFEIGFDQGESVPKLLEERGFKFIQVKKDLAGLDRVVIARKG